MSYSIRNSVILAGLLIIILLGSYLVNAKSAKKLEELEKSNKESSTMLEDLKRANPDLGNEEKVMKSLEKMKRKVLENSKLVLKEDNATLTYQYLIDITENFCPDVTFDFQVSKSGEYKEFSFNTYNLAGKANIESLHFFIFQIEYQSPLYTIESIKLAEESVIEVDTVNFKIVINSYFNKTGTDFKDIPLRSFKFTNLRYNPFYSRIHAPIPDPYELQFLNIYTSSIIGLTPYKVFLRDEHGKINTLSPGDKVAFGYLDHINWHEQCAVFKINRIGITEEEILYINNENQ